MNIIPVILNNNLGDVDTPNAHKQIWILYLPTKEYLTLKGGHVRVSKTYCLLILKSEIL